MPRPEHPPKGDDMELNVILAGVGGQGILTTAAALTMAAIRRGLSVKQAEVHGMSQRGGAVQSHLRIADHPLYSDLIPHGRADMILAVEPLEALRYVDSLCGDGVIISNTSPVVNIPNYGNVDDYLQRISRRPNHILIDASNLAGIAGSTRAVNMVMLGACSIELDWDPAEYDAVIAEMFAAKGPKLIAVNQRAFALGRRAARMYRELLARGADAMAARQWIADHPNEEPDTLAQVEGLPSRVLEPSEALTPEQTARLGSLLDAVWSQERRQLYEHEVYQLLEVAGAISPPRHFFVHRGEQVTEQMLNALPGDRVVLKIVSPTIVHKSDAQAVVFVTKDYGIVPGEVDQLIARQQSTGARVDGVLVVERVEYDRSHIGGELFVGIRQTREFGPVIAAGLGGVDTEYLAARLRPGIAVAKALATHTSAREFLDLFRKTAAYEVLTGRVRGHRRIVSDGQLLRCFAAFIATAREFCLPLEDAEVPRLDEMEVNPFAFRQMAMVPLDGRGRLGRSARCTLPRPAHKLRCLLEPKSIAVVGVSAKRENFGRIILNNIRHCGFPTEHLYVIKDDVQEIDGVPCVAAPSAAPEPIDLLIVSAAVEDVPGFVSDVINSGRVSSAILIPGGFGETSGTQRVSQSVGELIEKSRRRTDGGPIFLGGNCLGVRSRPGRYDTFFIHDKKLDPRRAVPAKRLALVCQSGAFIVSRLSNLPTLDPALAISLGNQSDLTVSDLMAEAAQRDDLDVIGVYMEGFRDGDGLEFVRAVRAARDAGKVIVFYKAGRTEAGRSATAGHTASIAGDYDVCDAAVGAAGAIVVDTFKEFEQVLELAVCLHKKPIGGRRIGAISNAGFEAVGMADATIGTRYRVELPALAPDTTRRLSAVLAKHRLESLVNIRNPLDVTPMASDEAYEDGARVLFEADEIDAVLVSMVPLTPAMLTAVDEIDDPRSIACRLVTLRETYNKPLIVVIDSGSPFDALADALRRGHIPVLRSCDQAIRSLGRYLCHRAASHRCDAVAPAAEQLHAETVGAV